MTNNTKSETSELAATLADFLCFDVYSTNLTFGRIYKPLLDEIGLTYPQFIALVALSEQDNQTIGSLGDKLFLESSTLAPLLKRLEGMGDVTRRRLESSRYGKVSGHSPMMPFASSEKGQRARPRRYLSGDGHRNAFRIPLERPGDLLIPANSKFSESRLIGG